MRNSDGDGSLPPTIILREDTKGADQLRAHLEAFLSRQQKPGNPAEPAAAGEDAAAVFAPTGDHASGIRVTSLEIVPDSAASPEESQRPFRVKRSTPLLTSPSASAKVIVRLPPKARIQVSETTGDYYTIRDDGGEISGYVLRADLEPDRR